MRHNLSTGQDQVALTSILPSCLYVTAVCELKWNSIEKTALELHSKVLNQMKSIFSSCSSYPVAYCKPIVQVIKNRIIHWTSQKFRIIHRASQKIWNTKRTSQKFRIINQASQKIWNIHRASKKFRISNRASQKIRNINRASQKFRIINQASQKIRNTKRTNIIPEQIHQASFTGLLIQNV